MAKPDFKVKILTVKIDEITPRDDNPRDIDRKEYDTLKKSIQEFPEMKQLREIVVDEDFKILAGTQRYYAQKELGYADVLVKQAIGLSDKQKRRFMALDNHHSGKWDEDIIANFWDFDELKSWGISNFDFGVDLDLGSDIDKKEKSISDKVQKVVCPFCDEEFDL